MFEMFCRIGIGKAYRVKIFRSFDPEFFFGNETIYVNQESNSIIGDNVFCFERSLWNGQTGRLP